MANDNDNDNLEELTPQQDDSDLSAANDETSTEEHSSYHVPKARGW